jgi:hypothetical protein
MKINNLLVLAIMVITINACRGTVEKGMIPTRAVIKYVDFEIVTPIHINRELFEKYFSSNISVLAVDDVPFLDSLNTIILQLEPSTQGFKPDVRILIKLIYPDNSAKIVALSDIALEVDGSEMTFEPKLISLIKTKLK